MSFQFKELTCVLICVVTIIRGKGVDEVVRTLLNHDSVSPFTGSYDHPPPVLMVKKIFSAWIWQRGECGQLLVRDTSIWVEDFHYTNQRSLRTLLPDLAFGTRNFVQAFLCTRHECAHRWAIQNLNHILGIKINMR